MSESKQFTFDYHCNFFYYDSQWWPRTVWPPFGTVLQAFFQISFSVFIRYKLCRFGTRHTTVLPFIIIEMRTTHHRYPSRSCGLLAVCTFAVGYVVWMCWVHSVTGVWVYPLLEHIGQTARVFFFICLTVLISVYYILGEILNNYIWDSSRSSLESDKAKTE